MAAGGHGLVAIGGHWWPEGGLGSTLRNLHIKAGSEAEELDKHNIELVPWRWDGTSTHGSHMGLSENVVYPEKPNGFADHYPY